MTAKEQLAKDTLKVWYDAAKKYPTNFNMPFEDFVSILQDSTNGTFLANFGSAIGFAQDNISYPDIQKAMSDLAVATQGLVDTFPDGAPKSSFWFDALSAKAAPDLTNYSYLKQFVPKVAAESAKGLSELAIGGLSLYLLGTLIVGGVALYFALKPAGKAHA